MTKKEQSIVQELLSSIYLRLNGYLTSGFLIHSGTNQLDGEVDIVAVRFPGHNQDYTEHNSSDFLEIPKNTDIIIGEVKAKGKKLQFNNALRQQSRLEPWIKILRWIGLTSNQDQIIAVAKELNALVIPSENSKRKHLLSTGLITTGYGQFTIRPIIFSPERINCNNADKFISWTELNDFIWMCLCPSLERERCGTRYDFTCWGQGYSEIVRAYKERQRTQNKFKIISELYAAVSGES